MKNILLMNMSGVCLNQEMFNERKIQINQEELEVIDCTKISGTDCYCDDTAVQKLKVLMEPYSAEGLHYIDGGNYHYLSKLWTDKINKDFDLVVFDHHPDMQPPLFGPILSCGSWIKDTIDANPNLKNVYIIGVNDELITQEMRQPYFADRENSGNAKVHFITKQMLAKQRKKYGRINAEELVDNITGDCISEESVLENDVAERIVDEKIAMEDIAIGNASIGDIAAEGCASGDNSRKKYIYISIDKDVLCENEYKTNWDQGDMSVDELLEMLELIFCKRNVIGIDVCGEMDLTYAQENPQWNITNNRVNNRLMHFINYLEKNWDNSVDNSNV